jgi:hypothetical protein
MPLFSRLAVEQAPWPTNQETGNPQAGVSILLKLWGLNLSTKAAIACISQARYNIPFTVQSLVYHRCIDIQTWIS